MISIEGNLCSGKTELINWLCKSGQFTENVNLKNKPDFLWEHYHGWDLNKVGENGSSQCFLTQSFKLSKMFEVYSDLPKNVYNIVECSPFSNPLVVTPALYKSKFIFDIERKILYDQFVYLNKITNVNIDMVIYLKTPVEICKKRLLESGKTERTESEVQVLLENIELMYNNWLTPEKNGCLCSCAKTPKIVNVVDGSLPMNEIFNEVVNILSIFL